MVGDGTKEFHVAVIGAGIAGLALAMALHRKDVPFTLYEEANEYSAVGAGIGFGPNGLRALDLIEPGFREKYESICVGNKWANDQHVFFEGLLMEEGLGMKENWYGHSSWGGAPYIRKSAHRKALLDIMTSFIPIENVRFNKRLTSIQQHADSVTLTFADGEIVQTSAVAGADGIQSTVREHVLQHEPSQVAPVYADSYCYRAVIPMEEAERILDSLTDTAKFYFGHDRSCVTYRISQGREFNFLLCVSDNEGWKLPNSVTETISHEAMMADFEGRGIDDRFLQLLSYAKPIKWGFFHHPRTSTYVRDRVVLCGDSAHASLPNQAAGAGQGVEDAFVLGSLLAEIANNARDRQAAHLQAAHIRAALDGYDRVRRPRAQKQLEQSAEVAQMIMFQHPEAGDDMGKILPMLQQGRFDWLWYHDIEEDVEEAKRRMDEFVNG